MRIAGWLLVALGFVLGFGFGFGLPLTEALPVLGSAEAAGGIAHWVLVRPAWVVPMLLGVAVLTVSGWLSKDAAGQA
jgi:hypothetical protein